LIASALFTEYRQAAGAAFFASGIFGAAVPGAFIFFIANTLMPGGTWLCWSPCMALYLAFDEHYVSAGRDYWTALAVVLILALAGIAGACLLLPRVWRDETPFNPLAAWLARKRKKGLAGAPPEPRLALADMDPFLWLGLRNANAKRSTRIALIMMAPLVIWFFTTSTIGFKTIDNVLSKSVWAMVVWTAIMLGFASHVLFKFRMAFDACARLNEDRASGALELLLATPVEDTAMISGHRAAAKKKFQEALKNLFAFNIFIATLSAICHEQVDIGKSEIPLFVLIFLGGAVLLVLDSWAIFWVGAWQGFKSRNLNRAVLVTLGQVTGPGWLALPLLILAFSSFRSSGSGFTVILLWMMFNALVAAVAGSRARAKLAPGLRALMQRDERPR
jgi:hypothetical protein